MDDAGIYAREVEAIGRVVQIGVAAGQIISVSFPDGAPPDAAPDHPLLDRVCAALEGETDDLADVPVALTLPSDRRRVLEAVRQVPSGERASLEQIARLAGVDPEDDRTLVVEALEANPVPVVIPDHRVDGAGATPQDVVERLRRVES